eukprot:CAMPEP_0185847420 /NCGR_PEP_ID=MMETSP1354-20130828/2700_1 /TAXON_ID=708628 /ORGANISM="Erythrolobus madagascarensis, Strain CCMP3276" /LENGTH=155 /DNA_ID=CAMNT_0028547711 /DNA_START=60 /DNA_END=527 /DNA_ORIENTATION=+
MASIVWMGIFVLLCFEMVLTALFCAPLPWGFRKLLLKISRPIKAVNAVRTAILFIIIGLGIAVASSVQEMTKAQQREEHIKFNVDSASVVDVWEYSKVRQNRFRSERNMYLSLMTLTLSMVLWRLLDLFHNEAKLRDELKNAEPVPQSVEEKKQN